MKYRADIDGLRAVAVILVVLSHLGLPGFAGGYVGVDVFFVISGYLITGILVRHLDGDPRMTMREFYFRRAKRILPMAILVLAVTCLVAFAVLNEVKTRQIATDSFWAAIFAANLHLIQQSADYFGHGFSVSPVQHYWSLAVEEQFYLVFPLLLLAISRMTSGRSSSASRKAMLAMVAGLSACSLALSVWQSATLPSVAYFSSGTRAFELGIGAVLALAIGVKPLLWSQRVRNLVGVGGLVAIVAADLVFSAKTVFPGWAALLPTLGAAAVIAAGSRALSLAPVVYVGKISFSLYLWHWPIIVLLPLVAPGFETSGWRSIPVLGFTLVLSSLSYRFVERPFRAMGSKLDLNRSSVRRALANVGFLVALAVAGSAAAATGGTFNTAQTSLWPNPTSDAGGDKYAPSPAASPTAQPTASGSPSSSPSTSPSESASPSPQVSGSTSPSASASASPSASAKPSAKPAAKPKPSAKPTVKPTPKPKPNVATYESLLNAWQGKVEQATKLTTVPDGLNPPISSLLTQRGVQWGQCMDARYHAITCQYGPADAKHTAVILGDSYALAIYPMVIEALGLTDWHVIGLNQRECMISDVVPWSWTGDGANLDCPDHRAWVNTYLAQIHPDLVVLSDQVYHPIADGNKDAAEAHDHLWAVGLDKALAALRPLAANIVYFGLPTSQGALTDCVGAGSKLLPACTSSTNTYSGYVALQSQFSQKYKIPFIDSNDWLCAYSKCPPIIDNTPVYWDGAHFTQDFSAKLAPLFAAFLREHGLLG